METYDTVHCNLQNATLTHAGLLATCCYLALRRTAQLRTASMLLVTSYYLCMLHTTILYKPMYTTISFGKWLFFVTPRKALRVKGIWHLHERE